MFTTLGSDIVVRVFNVLLTTSAPWIRPGLAALDSQSRLRLAMSAQEARIFHRAQLTLPVANVSPLIRRGLCPSFDLGRAVSARLYSSGQSITREEFHCNSASQAVVIASVSIISALQLR